MIDVRGHSTIFSPFTFKRPVHIVGCGGMGSHLAIALVRMGLGRTDSPISLYDKDVYERHNLANQAITKWSVGRGKVYGLAKELRRIEPGIQVRTYAEEVGSNFGHFGQFDGVVILCLDDMFARNTIVRYFLANNPNVECVIETRMDARVGISHCFDPRNPRHVECWWLYWNYPNESENAMGCDGYQSIISAIYGTSMLALKQFESFARFGTALGHPNRIYQEFDEPRRVIEETWPVAA